MEDSVFFQIARFLSIYDVYKNMIDDKSTKKTFIISEDFSKENMLILVLSNLYSLFDGQKSSQSLKKITFKNIELEKKREAIIEDWLKIEDPIKKIRHNIGFHTSKDIAGQVCGIDQFKGKINENPFELIGKLTDLYFSFIVQRSPRCP